MPDPFELEIELALVKEDLAALPADAFNERITLRDRIIELEAAIGATTPLARDSLRAELAELRAKHDELRRTRINPSTAHGGIGLAGGVDPNFLHKANRRIDAMTGINEVEDRIRQIERLLDTGSDGPLIGPGPDQHRHAGQGPEESHNTQTGGSTP